MNLEIKDRKKNALMKREEAVVSIEHGGKATPNRKHILDEASKLFKAKTDCIIIDRIITQGGKAFSEARVLVYSKRDDIPAWRLKKMEQRLAKAKKKAEEQPAEAPKPEEKKEAPPEEPKPEEPAEEKAEEAPSEEKEAEPAPEEPSGEEKPEEKEPGKGE